MHIRSLRHDSLANRVWQEQLAFDWPGLAEEAAKICAELDIENVSCLTPEVCHRF